MHCLHHPLVGLDLQTVGAAVDVQGESWSQSRKGNRTDPCYTGMLLRDHGEQQHHLCVWRVQRGSGVCSNKAWRDSQQLCECQQWLSSQELKKDQGLGNATKHMDKSTDPSAGGWGLFLRDKPMEKQPGTAAGRSRSREGDGQELPLPKARGFGQSRERQQSC